MANVKEFLLRPETGEVNVEYDDNSTNKFNLANTVTARSSELGTELYAGGEVLALPGGVQVPSDWNAVAGVARILNKPTILDAEAVQDLVAAMFASSHTNLTATYNDATGTLTLSAAGGGGGGTTAEEVQDFLNTALAHGNHSGITVTYDDVNNRFVFTVAGGVANLTLTGDATTVSINVNTGTDVVIPAATAAAAGVATAAQITKLNGIATAATANSTDAQLRDRTTHTGAQAISTVAGLQAALDAKQAALASGTNIKTVNGQSLLGGGDITIAGAGSGANLTSTVTATTVSVESDTGTDVVIASASAANAGVMAAADKSKLDGIAAGATNTPLSSTVPAALGTAAVGSGSTAARADHVHSLPAVATTSVSGLLSNTDKAKLDGIAAAATANSTDAQLRDRSTHTGTQAISTVTGLQTALAAKQDALVSGTNIKTINGTSLLGGGDVVITGVGGGDGINANDVGYDLVLVVGQSNAVGGGSGTADPYLDPVDPRVWRYVASTSTNTTLAPYKDKVSLAYDPLGHPFGGGGVGPAMEFARNYVRIIPSNRRVLLVPAARGGASLVDGTPDISWNTTYSNGLFTLCVAQAKAALAAAGPNSRVTAILFVQGEAEAQGFVGNAAYSTHFSTLIAALKAQIPNSADAAVVIGSMVQSWVRPYQNWRPIASSHELVSSRMDKASYALGPYGTGDVHYTAAEAKVLGYRMFDAYITARDWARVSGVPNK